GTRHDFRPASHSGTARRADHRLGSPSHEPGGAGGATRCVAPGMAWRISIRPGSGVSVGPATPDTLYKIGSLSKQFIAAGIVHLSGPARFISRTRSVST